MEKKMIKTSVLMAVAVCIMLMQLGCGGGSNQARTGFLTDYSRLEKESDSTLRFMNAPALDKYSSFVVDRVEVHLHSGAKSKGKLTDQEISDLTNYMTSKVNEAVHNAGKQLLYQPQAGVARIRVALTDLNKSTGISYLPQAKLFGAGVGGASMEAEIVDSMTGEQIGAVVESKQGTRMPFANLGEWDAAKQVVDDWAKRLQKRLDEVH